MRNSRDDLRDTLSRGRARAPPTSARFRCRKARGCAFGPRDRPTRRTEIESDMERFYFEKHRTRDIAAGRPLPPRSGPADHIRGEPVPRRGWKWWTCGNGRMPDFQERAGSPFPTDLLEIHKPYERHDFQISAAIFVHIRLLVA